MVAMVFFFNDTPTTEIYTLSLHDALPIFPREPGSQLRPHPGQLPPSRSGRPPHGDHRGRLPPSRPRGRRRDRKSTRLNSSHANISYAVFCLKKKNKTFHTLQ